MKRLINGQPSAIHQVMSDGAEGHAEQFRNLLRIFQISAISETCGGLTKTLKKLERATSLFHEPTI